MHQESKSITYWLILCCTMLVLIVFVGGLTRLTNSGLSIVEWKPVTGIIPPLDSTDWVAEFSKYQTSPEYQQSNYNMTLDEFKRIFWLEYLHRLLGRFIGLIYLLPLGYFYFTKQLNRSSHPAYLLITCLFFAQGFMGWYMVKSGLVNLPHVSHWRLAAHLMLAIAIYSLLFWQLMKHSFDMLITGNTDFSTIKASCIIATIVLCGQIFLGALVAGLKAGLIYNSFPLMGLEFVPTEIYSEPLSLTSFSDPVFVQFMHRMNAYLLCFVTLILAGQLVITKHPRLQKVALVIVACLLAQMFAGIATIIYVVPIGFALLHQFLAIALLSSLLWCHFLIK